MTQGALAPQMRELIVRLARQRRGLAILHLCDLEPAAVMLGVDARVVAQARRALDTPDGRKQLIAAVRQARRESGAAEAPRGSEAADCRGSSPCPPRRASELIHAAAEHEYGLEFLRDGYLESVAVIFQVHPKLVLRSRALLQRWEARRTPLRKDG